ncbi:MAG: SagB/ThcOx family dehydrogenase [Verrucomicrobia bacterium]|nr:SagB/ThcOx family dehydrogenase [Verrucomicrobiota bacterium]
MKAIVAFACTAAVLLIAASCGTSETDRAPETRKLPEPSLKGTLSVEEALATRRSVRALAGRALSDEQLAQILWAAQGITQKDRGLRTAPSAGALYPIEIYVFLSDGVWRYSPQTHTLTLQVKGDQRDALSKAALGQGSVSANGVVILIAADIGRTMSKYGERARQYVHIEVGCVCQNVLLQVTALGLVGVPVGAFTEAEVKRVAALPEAQTPQLLIPLGFRRE